MPSFRYIVLKTLKSPLPCFPSLYYRFFTSNAAFGISQTAYIPDELYKQVYDVCKRLLTYPQPYCSVGLGCSRQIKMERSTPGTAHTPGIAGYTPNARAHSLNA